ncbi:TRM11 family SAM-dependent methyltransferase [Nocardia wallacei]|uniref:TRM11 family SAM-dependent methyltransferase n=1 Tax=Nocardia wallacei TaxID=480035 RepID=UPI002456F94A|nr:DNA methyltransferase [Nocardia wallacei]
MPTPDATPDTPVPDTPAAVSVWATSQTAPAAQRGTRYTRASSAHPAKMLPAIAAEAIARYSTPGDLVMDPMCGIGTTLVEAVHTGRRALGVEYEQRWADIARENLALARAAGHDTDAEVYAGDARKLARFLPAELHGTVDLLITSPPYGDSIHGRVQVRAGEGVRKYNHRYGNTLDRGNLANLGVPRLLSGFTRILTAAADYVKPGGHVVITARPWRQHAELIDLPSMLSECAATAGLVPVDRAAALLGRLADGGIVAHSSFFQRDFVLKNRDAGLPLALIAHEDVLVYRRNQLPPNESQVQRRRAGTDPAAVLPRRRPVDGDRRAA